MTTITRWYVAFAAYGSPGFTHYCDHGWEPFAVTGWADQTAVWFRMATKRNKPNDPRTQLAPDDVATRRLGVAAPAERPGDGEG